MTGRYEIIPPSGGQSGGRFEVFAPNRERGRDGGDAGGRFAAALSGAADTATFGTGDEIMGFLLGEEAMRESRLRQGRLRAAHPVSFGAGQVAGAVVGGGGIGAAGRAALGGARALQGVNWAGRAGLSAVSGGAGYSAYGAGSAGDGARLEAAAQNFLPGAAMGGLMSVGGSALGPVAQRIWQGASPRRSAADLLAQGIQREGGEQVVIQRLGEHAAMNRGGTMLDAMGESGAHLASGFANRPSAGRSAMRDMFDARNQAMGPRAQQEIAQEFAGAADDVGGSIARIEARRAVESQPLYARAYAQMLQPQQVSGMRQMLALDARLAPADRILTRAAEAARSSHIQRTGVLNPTRRDMEASPRYWHDMLEAAQDTLGMQLRAARTGAMDGLAGSSAARATERMSRFNRYVRNALGDDFRQAQDIYAGASRMMRAQELGYEMVGQNFNSLRVGEAMREVRRMSQGEREQLRVAAASRLRDMIANADPLTGRTDVLRTITRSEGQRRLFDSIFGQGRLNELIRRFEYDRRLFQNGVSTGIRANSHTAPIMASERAIDNAIATPATTPGSMFERLFGPELRRAAERRSEAVADEFLSMAATPAQDALRAIQTRSPMGTRGGLLARARRLADERQQFRRRASVGAATNFYSGVGGEPLADHLMGGGY